LVSVSENPERNEPLHLNQIFASREKFEDFVQAYGIAHGFSTRKESKKSPEKQQDMVCSRSGHGQRKMMEKRVMKSGRQEIGLHLGATAPSDFELVSKQMLFGKLLSAH